MNRNRNRSLANEQREALARSRAWTTGIIAVLGAFFGLALAACCLWNSIGGAT